MMLIPLLLLPLAQTPPQVAPPHLALERYRADTTRSVIGFDGTSTLHDFTARTSAIEGEIRTDIQHPSRFTAGRLRVDAATLDTHNSDRDEKMREHLEVERFPYIDFIFDHVEGELDHGSGTLQVTGSFHIHGIRKQRQVATECSPAPGGGLHFTGRTRFPMSDHGVDPPTVMVITVADPIDVFFDIVLTPVPAQPRSVLHRTLTVTDQVTSSMGETQSSTSSEHLWIDGEKLLWTRDGAGRWLYAQEGKGALYDISRGEALSLPGPCDEAFDETRGQAERLRARLAKLPDSRKARVQEVVDRMAASLALAPDPGPLRVETDGGTVRWYLGETLWLEADGLDGDTTGLGSLLTGFEGLPREVRRALPSLQGLPQTLMVRTATPSASHLYRIEFQEPEAGTVPDWAWKPSSWMTAKEDRSQ